MAKANPNPKGSRVYKLLKVPLKILAKARDFYFKSMELYGNNGMVFPTAAPHVSNLPKSFSVNSTNNSNSELPRASSTRNFGNKIQIKKQAIRGPNYIMAPRSRSVAIGRIDEEEEPYDAFEDVKIKTREMYPRSQSHAVHRRAWYGSSFSEGEDANK